MQIDESRLLQQYEIRRRYWRARDDRMDFWHLTYLLFDAHQMAKPPGRMSFVSNEPANIVDKGASAIARNRVRLNTPIEQADAVWQREEMSLVEDVGYGILDEIDELLARRGSPGPAREVASKQALLRGWIAACMVLQPNSDESFLWYDDWDPRFTYPDYDKYGMRSVLNYSEETLSDIVGADPSLEQFFTNDDDFTQPVQKFIYYDRKVHGCLAYLPRRRERLRSSSAPNAVWLSKNPETGAYGPYEHGLPDIPVVMIPVNGLPFKYAPSFGANNIFGNAIQSQQDLRWAESSSRYEQYRLAGNHWVADWGRSIFANAEQSFKQFNELVSTVWQVVNNEAYGTWTMKTRDGRVVPLQLGNNVVNYLRLDEALDKINPHIAPPSITDLLAISARENERATFSFKLFGDQFEGSGFLFNQVQEGMANALHPFRGGVEQWASRIARMGLRQFRLGGFEDLTLYGRRPQSKHIFTAQVSSDMIQRDYRIDAELTLSVPDDMMAKIQMARLLADPRRPLASIQTIFDKILGWDDPDGEKERIFEDVADTDPVIILERVRKVLDKRGLPELAAAMGEKEFVARAVQAMQVAQAQGQLQQLMGPNAGAGAPAEAGGQNVSPPNPTATGAPPADQTYSMGGPA